MQTHIGLVVVAQLVVTSAAGAQQNPVQWGDTAAQKMSRFLPQPGASLIPHSPWGRPTDNQVAIRSGGTQTMEYQDAAAEQIWVFDDPALFQQVAAAQKERSDLDQAHSADLQSHAAERSAQQAQLQALLKSGQQKDAQALIAQMKAADTAYQSHKSQLDARLSKLQAGVRQLNVSIVANSTPYDQMGPKAQPAGSLGGHPLYHPPARASGDVPPEFVGLFVYLGPPGLRIATAKTAQLKVKCILVRVDVFSRAPHPETIQADSTVARQMLDRVDYASLAKYLSP